MNWIARLSLYAYSERTEYLGCHCRLFPERTEYLSRHCRLFSERTEYLGCHYKLYLERNEYHYRLCHERPEY